MARNLLATVFLGSDRGCVYESFRLGRNTGILRSRGGEPDVGLVYGK